MRECERCVVGSAYLRSKSCKACSKTIDRIILRAAEGDVPEEDLAAELGLAANTLSVRKSRLLRGLR